MNKDILWGLDVGMIGWWAFVFLTARYILQNYVFGPWYRSLNQANPKLDHETIEKFSKACWHCLAYSLLWMYSVSLFFQQEWSSTPIEGLWKDWPHLDAEKYKLHTLYVTEFGFYIHAFISSVFLEPKRSDYLVILAHHVISLSLITGSWAANFHRIGLCVFVEQDIGDVLLYMAKIVHYTTAKSIHLVIAYVSMAIGFILTRVVWLALMVWSCWFIAHKYVLGAVLYTIPPSKEEFLRCSLLLLLLMQVFWTYKLLWVGWTLATKKMIIDPIYDHGKPLPNTHSSTEQDQTNGKKDQ